MKRRFFILIIVCLLIFLPFLTGCSCALCQSVHNYRVHGTWISTNLDNLGKLPMPEATQDPFQKGDAP